MLFDLFKTSAELTIIFTIIVLFVQWLFIYTAVKSGSKKAIIEAYNEIESIKKNPPKTIDEQIKEELEGWS